MSETTQTVEPVVREVVVGCSAERAFDVFTAEMTSWWPSGHHIGEAPIAEVVVEPRVGGRWFTRHTDGSETFTGQVLAFDRPHRLVVTWQIGADWRFDPSLVTTVEVGFEETADGRTRVRLEHRDLDAYAERAAQMKELFERPGAWDGTLESFAAATA